MSFLGFIGKALKTVAPIGAAFIPGIGPLAAAGLAAGGSTLGDAIDGGGFNLGGDLMAGAGGALGNLALGGKGYTALGSLLKGGTLPNIKVPIMGPGGEILGYRDVAGATSGNSALGGLLSGKNLPYLLGAGAGAISAAGQNSKANSLLNEALTTARQSYAEKAPLRSRALSLLTGPMPTPPDLSNLRSMGNPYAAQHSVPAALPAPMAGAPPNVPPPPNLHDLLPTVLRRA